MRLNKIVAFTKNAGVVLDLEGIDIDSDNVMAVANLNKETGLRIQNSNIKCYDSNPSLSWNQIMAEQACSFEWKDPEHISSEIQGCSRIEGEIEGLSSMLARESETILILKPLSIQGKWSTPT